MKIILTNDDGFEAKGLQVLVQILSAYGDLIIVAPKFPQSGMSMAVTMGFKPIAVKHLSSSPGQDWWYLDGTPASCVKFALDNVLAGQKADLVVSGINHGSNAATAAIYSGTLGAAMEGAVNGVPAIGVSLDSFSKDADFSAIEALLPGILDKILACKRFAYGDFLNINFPNLPASEIVGTRICSMGSVHWENEYQDYSSYMAKTGREPSPEALQYLAQAEDDEQIYLMAGDMTDNGDYNPNADHRALEQGYITITPHNTDNSRFDSAEALRSAFKD